MDSRQNLLDRKPGDAPVEVRSVDTEDGELLP
jgi:hypothetical protein